MKVIFTIFLLCFANSASSQSGTYSLASIPKEAIVEKSEGVYEFPIYIGTTKIKLKWWKRTTIVYDEGEDSEEVLRGRWSKDGNLIKVKCEAESEVEIIEFTIVEYESGTYLKRGNTNHHYKKQ